MRASTFAALALLISTTFATILVPMAFGQGVFDAWIPKSESLGANRPVKSGGGATDLGCDVTAIPDLPVQTVQILCVAVASSEIAPRQLAIAELWTWARRQPDLLANWGKIASVQYDPARTGSSTSGENPDRIRITLGTEPFLSAADLYSVFRHELVHARQYETREQSLAFGWGWMEVNAYLWELEHASRTGLARAPIAHGADHSLSTQKGLPRAIDGLFRSIQRLSVDLEQDPNRLNPAQQLELQRRIACAAVAQWAYVHELYPSLDHGQLAGQAVGCGPV